MGKGIGNIVKVATLGLVDPNAGINDAAKAVKRGAGAAALGQQNAMDYLQQQQKLPMELRESALKGLGGLYGLQGGDAGYGQKLTDLSMQSPIYKAMAGQIDQTLMDNQDQTGASASQRGLLGSGVLADALAKYRARAGVDKSNALSQVYQQNLGGATGMSNLQGYQGDIASLMAGKGMTIGQGISGAEQARQQGYQQTTNTAMELTGDAVKAFSDIRLKSDVRFIGKIAGHEWYSWTWNDVAAKLGLSGNGEGVMAHEVEKYMPDAIGEYNGFMTVNYAIL